MNNENQLRKIGLDPGFSTIKLAEVQNGAVRTFVMPSRLVWEPPPKLRGPGRGGKAAQPRTAAISHCR